MESISAIPRAHLPIIQNNNESSLVLHEAVRNYDNEYLLTLLQQGYDVNAVDESGRTALHVLLEDGTN